MTCPNPTLRPWARAALMLSLAATLAAATPARASLTTVSFEAPVGSIGSKVPVPAYFYGSQQPDPLPLLGQYDKNTLKTGDLFHFSITLRDLTPNASFKPFTIADVESLNAPFGSYTWGTLWMPQIGLYSTDAQGKVTAIGFDIRDDSLSLALFKNMQGYSTDRWLATQTDFGADPLTGARWGGACGFGSSGPLDGTCFGGSPKLIGSTIVGQDPHPVAEVSEPGSLALAALSLGGLWGLRRRR